MQSNVATVDEYLEALPEDRREALQQVRTVILENLDPTFEEGMQYGMVGYYIPHSVYPAGYHCDPKQPLPFAGMASQKQHLSLYLSCVYGSEEERASFVEQWIASGKKLTKSTMGKACIRFKKVEDLPLDLIGKTIKRWTAKKYIALYEGVIKR